MYLFTDEKNEIYLFGDENNIYIYFLCANGGINYSSNRVDSLSLEYSRIILLQRTTREL